MAFLEHHLAAHPEETAPLVAHARRGALRVVGGAMTSPDTLLQETELLARDLLRDHERSLRRHDTHADLLVCHRARSHTAGALRGDNVNTVTDERFIEPLVGTSILNGVPVRVERDGA